MHDPLTLIGELPLPRGGGLMLWHTDPCRDGSDDSCGWSFPKLTSEQLKLLRGLAFWEARERVFLRCASKEWNGSLVEAEHLYRSLIFAVARVLNVSVTFDEAASWASHRMSIGGCESATRLFCFLPGWHTNRKEDLVEDREQHFHGVAAGIARELLRRQRRWWQHPRWHIHHWRIHFRWPQFRRVRSAESAREGINRGAAP